MNELNACKLHGLVNLGRHVSAIRRRRTLVMYMAAFAFGLTANLYVIFRRT
jgi:hypothetical protein